MYGRDGLQESIKAMLHAETYNLLYNLIAVLAATQTYYKQSPLQTFEHLQGTLLIILLVHDFYD